MTLKEEIKTKIEQELCTIDRIEIATIKLGIVAVWANGFRYKNYDINKHEFCDPS